jgi:hypothetical protein
MSWTKVNDTHLATPTTGLNGTPQTDTIAAATIGNLLVAMFTFGASGSPTITSISGGGAATWLKAVSTAGASFDTEIWYGVVTSATANTTLTVNISFGANYILDVAEFSWSGGAATAATVEASTAGSNTSSAIGTAINTGTVTPTAGRDAVIACCWSRNGSATKTSGPTNSFTELTGASNISTSAYLLVASTAGSYSAAWVYTNNYATYHAAIAVFSIGSAGPTTKPGFFRMFG